MWPEMVQLPLQSMGAWLCVVAMMGIRTLPVRNYSTHQYVPGRPWPRCIVLEMGLQQQPLQDASTFSEELSAIPARTVVKFRGLPSADPSTNQWTALPVMLVGARAGAVAVSLRERAW